MPGRHGHVIKMEQLSCDDRLKVPSGCQRHWYGLAGRLMHDWSVLDVGSGTGYGLSILRGASCRADGIDLLPAGMDVQKLDVSNVAAGAYDGAVCIDVIEHVDNDVAMLGHLCRVAKRGVFISTPNWDVYHASNPFHVREYRPGELLDLLALITRRHSRVLYGSNNHKNTHKLLRPDDLRYWCNFGVYIKFED